MNVQWHVFYRTTGMRETQQRGYLRADFLAETAEEALNLLLAKKQACDVRVYPGAAAYTVHVEWETPEIVVKHEPH